MNAALVARLCSRRGLLYGLQGRNGYFSASQLYSSTTARAVPGQQEDFFERNKRLGRPMSPHLTIYKPQITSVLSVTHRGTGIALSVLTSGFAIAMMALPGSFPYYLGLVASMQFGPALIGTAKFLLAFPFFFHLNNGIRHLMWDLGKGFTIKSVYAGGWTVLGTSILFSLIAAIL